MEAFKVFSVFSLKDLVSSPLKRIKEAMASADGAVASLSNRFGKLALAMAPVALAAGVIAGSFGSCMGVAADFEDAMARVGAISQSSAAEMALLEESARHLGATTRYTASQVAEAQMYLAMAGFKATQNIAALPGVLSLASATATDLGRTSDIASDILSGFGHSAEEMSRVADVLALTCATANTNLELLGETMKYVGPVARNAGMQIEEAAAMAGLLGNVGIKGGMAGTTLKSMINNIAAPASDAQKMLKSLGIQVKDSAGNLRSPVAILGELSQKLDGMGSAQQIAALKTLVGERAIAGFAELIEQEGIGSLSKYIDQLKNAGGTVEEMARRMNDTLAGSQRNMASAFESVQITVGKMFLPTLRKVVNSVTTILQLFDQFAVSPIGGFIIKLVATLSTAIIGIMLFSAGIWAFTKLGPLMAKALLPATAAIMGLGWPILLVIAAIAGLYLAYKTNFGGIADTVSGWWSKIRLIFNGVVAIFKVLKGSSFELRGELARDIKAAGLENFVVTIAKIVYRITELFRGIWDGIDLSGPLRVLAPVGEKVANVFSDLGDIIARVFGTEITGASQGFYDFGQILGAVISYGLEALATALTVMAHGLSIVVDLFIWLGALLTGDFSGACQAGERIWTSLCDTFMSFADLFRLGDWLREAWADASEILSSINLFDSGAAILDTLKEGIMSKWQDLKDSVSNAFQNIRDLLPFSDAKEGPLSQLTLNGSKIMTTLADGVQDGAGGLQNALDSTLQAASSLLGSGWDTLFDDKPIQDLTPEISSAPEFSPEPQAAGNAGNQQEGQGSRGNSYTFHIGQIVLPDAEDGQGFLQSLQDLIAEYGGDVETA